MIFLTELCSWYSVLAQSNIGHVFEESLWALAATSLSLGLLRIKNQPYISVKRWCLIAASAGLIYAIYMASIDVPMYWTRWLSDASHRWQVSMHWSDWQSEIVWMSIYFSVGVWFSIGFVHMPHPPTVPRLALRMT